ncbi:hypothetical protein HYT53_06245 [Candidatus Woesearchaeota archaeon]|nr:hypothetical protein [Candidatus Woesearchaeota archaeon]
MAGWLTKFFSKIFKAPFIMRWEMRGEGRTVFRVLRHMRFKIYNSIPEKVLKHDVTPALKEQKTLFKDSKKAVESEFELGFNEQVEETLSLKEVEEIEKRLMEHEKLHGPISNEAEFGRKIKTILANAHGEDRELYFKYLEPIIRVAEKRGDYKALMERLRLSMKDDESLLNILSALALRLEVRAASKGLNKLRRDKKRVYDALYTWDRVKKDKRLAELHIKTALAEIQKDIETELHNDTIIAKRDFLLTLLTLKYIDDDETLMEKYYRDQVMPKLPENERITDFEELKTKLAEHAHVLAQGLRRIMAAEEEAGKLALGIEAAAQTKREAA